MRLIVKRRFRGAFFISACISGVPDRVAGRAGRERILDKYREESREIHTDKDRPFTKTEEEDV